MTADFAMFTPEGNAAVMGLVIAAEASKMTEAQVMAALKRLSQQPGCEECTDTEVREAVLYTVFPEMFV